LHRLAEIHHRQAVQQRTQKNGYRFVSASGTGLHRQAVPLGTQKTLTQACAAWWLCRARQAVSGNFPKIRISQRQQ